jgi:valyl-tRNA synthetase
VTPAHDPNDYAAGLRNKLPMINILTPDGRINEIGGKYAGLERYKAREAVVADMEALGLFLGREDRDIPLKYSDRSKTPIEPLLSDQWFVRMDTLAQAAIEAVTNRSVKFFPNATPVLILTGLVKNATGASADNYGGAIGFRSGTPTPPKKP